MRVHFHGRAVQNSKFALHDNWSVRTMRFARSWSQGMNSFFPESGDAAVQALFKEILRRVKGGTLTEVYPSFDAVPVSKKSNTCFTVIAPESVQLDAPFPVGNGNAYSFSAVFAVYVLIPMTQPLESADDLFYGTILPRMETLGCVLCETEPAHADIRLNRVVTKGKFRLRGVSVGEEADECSI